MVSLKLTATLLSIILYVVMSGTGLILLKIVMTEAASKPGPLLTILFNPKFILGFLLYACSFTLFMFILSKSRLNILYPVSTSLFFVFISIASFYVLKEAFSIRQVIGIGLCLLGVVLIGLK